MLLGSIQPIKLANISNINKKTERLMRILSALNILSEPSFPPLSNPISADPKLKKITKIRTKTIVFIYFLWQAKKKTPLRGLLSKPLTGNYSQYTKINSPSQTTSTKCQYQATPSKAKWLSESKCPF